MFERGDIFLGSTPKNERSFLTAVLKHARSRYAKFIVPCCGKFGALEAAVSVGWKPEQLYASDISLFTSVLACHLNDQNLSTIGGVEASGDLAELDLTHPPTVLYALKLAVLRNRAKNYYEELMVRDLEKRRDTHIEKLAVSMDALKEKIGGFQYQVRDLFEHLREAVDDAEAVIYCAPPSFHKGYEKMYDTGGAVTFPQPDYTLFNPKEGGYQQIRSIMQDRPALGLRFQYADPADEGEQREAVCLEGTGGGTGRKNYEYLLSNRPAEISEYLSKRVFTDGPMEIESVNAPILDESHAITEDSRITFMAVTAKQALYYRGLFVHRLAASNAESHLLFLIDGQIAGVIGLILNRVHRGKTAQDGRIYMDLQYCMGAPSQRYRRLNRLLVHLITSRQFADQFQWNLYTPDGIATTQLTPHPESKINRGILKLIKREKLPDGTFKLRYATEWKGEPYADILHKWLKHNEIRP